jgi:hypothetical protein
MVEPNAALAFFEGIETQTVPIAAFSQPFSSEKMSQLLLRCFA